MSQFVLAVMESVGSIGLLLVELLETHREILRAALFLIFLAPLALWLRLPRARARILPLMSLLLLLFVQLGASGGGADARSGILLGLAYLQLVLCTAISSRWQQGIARTRDGEAKARSPTGDPIAPPVPEISSRRRHLVALAVLVAAALPIRFWRLAEYPKFFSGEYVSWAEPAMQILEGKRSIALIGALDFTTGEYMDFSWVFLPDLVALSFLAFGTTVTAMRLVPTCFGILGVFLTWYVGRRWFGSRVGFAAAFLLAVSPVMIGMSRELHIQVAFLVPFTLIFFHFLLESLEAPRFRTLLAASALACFSFHLYRPALISAPLLLGFWGHALVRDREWRDKAWRPLLLSVPISALLLIPPLYYQLSGRFDGYAALVVPQYAGLAELIAGIPENLATVWRHIAYDGSPVQFTHGVGSYMQPGGTLYLPVVTALALIGIGHCAARLRERQAYRVLLALAIAGLLPALFSNGMSRRMIAFAPPFFLLAGCGATFLFALVSQRVGEAARSWKRPLAGLAAALLLSVGWGVFMDRAQAAAPDPSHDLAREVARRMESDELVVALFPTDHVKRAIKLFVVDSFRGREANERFWSSGTLSRMRRLKSARLPPVTHVTFVVRVAGTRATTCSIAQMDRRLERTASGRMHWESRAIGGDDARVPPHYYLLRVPITDFPEAWSWARACF